MRFNLFIAAITFAGILGLTPGTVAAAPMAACFSPQDRATLRLIRRALDQKNLWVGFKPTAAQIAFQSSKRTSLFFYQVPVETFVSAGVEHRLCSDVEGVFEVTVPKSFPAVPNGVHDFVFPGAKGYGALSEITETSRRPVLVFSLNGESGLNLNGTLRARILLHESFHMAHQYADGFRLDEIVNRNRDFFPECHRNAEWKSALQKEQNILRTIRTGWYTHSDQRLRDEIAKIAALRRNPRSGSRAAKCFGDLEAWERIEGTAHYLDMKTARHLGAYSRFPSDDEMDGNLDTPFYTSGAVHSLLLERLFPDSKWQERVNAGESPFDVLVSLLP